MVDTIWFLTRLCIFVMTVSLFVCVCVCVCVRTLSWASVSAALTMYCYVCANVLVLCTRVTNYHATSVSRRFRLGPQNKVRKL